MRLALFIVAFAAAIAFTAVGNSYYVFIMATLGLTALVGIGLNVLLGLTGQVSLGNVGFYAIGAYAVAVRHYVEGPPKPGFNWNDGAGFSRNPQISLLHLKPRLNDVLIHVNGHAAVDVVLNYRHGLSVGPIQQD